MTKYLLFFVGLMMAGILGTVVVSAQVRGGSNYAWYDLMGCNRDPYGVIKNYHKPVVRAKVDSQLQAMYDAGQRRLRIPICRGCGTDR